MDVAQSVGIMKRSRWITIGAIVFFFLVTAQMVFFAWKKSQSRSRQWIQPVETPEAQEERRRKDAITKIEVDKLLQKAIAEVKKNEK